MASTIYEFYQIYQNYIIELSILVISIVFIVRGAYTYKKEIKGEKDSLKLSNSKFLIIYGAFLLAVLFANSKVLHDPCRKNAASYECLDQELRLIIKLNQHRSGE